MLVVIAGTRNPTDEGSNSSCGFIAGLAEQAAAQGYTVAIVRPMDSPRTGLPVSSLFTEKTVGNFYIDEAGKKSSKHQCSPEAPWPNADDLNVFISRWDIATQCRKRMLFIEDLPAILELRHLYSDHERYRELSINMSVLSLQSCAGPFPLTCFIGSSTYASDVMEQVRFELSVGRFAVLTGVPGHRRAVSRLPKSPRDSTGRLLVLPPGVDGGPLEDLPLWAASRQAYEELRRKASASTPMPDDSSSGEQTHDEQGDRQ